MSQYYFDPAWTEKVTIPVKCVGNHWEFFYGGDIPVKDGTLGELALSAPSITDPSFLKRVSQILDIKVLPEGSDLLIALNDRSIHDINGWPDIPWQHVPNGTTRFERVTIGPLQPNQRPLSQEDKSGGLWLRLKGLERTEIRSSSILMPKDFPAKEANSLNHAFTLFSKEYEKHRISNTGNVYKQVFYQEQNGKWYPLGDLRRGAQAQGERALLASAWKEIEQALGWRPAGKESRK